MKKNTKPSLNQHKRFKGMPLLAIGAAAMVALTGSILANPPPTPEPIIIVPLPAPKLRVTVDSRPDRNLAAIQSANAVLSPSHPANLINSVVTDRITEGLRRIQGGGATAGADGKEVKETKEVAPPEGPQYSVFGEYSYLTSEDHREVATDSITNSVTGGFDMTLNKTLLGMVYYYAHASGSSDFLKSSTASDSNFVTIYAAQSLTNFLAVGVTGGYGNTEVDTAIRDSFFPTFHSEFVTNTYSTSPFVSLSYAQGNFYGSFTTAFQYLHTQSFSSDQLNFTLTGGYRFTSWLTGEVTGKYSQSVHNTQGGFPQDDWWFSVGPKLKEYITPRLYLYEGYTANLNTSFTQHMFTGGLSYSF